MLTRTIRRAQVGQMIATCCDLDGVLSLTIADAVDLAAGAPLRAAGLSDDDARAVLATMWADEPLPPAARADDVQ